MIKDLQTVKSKVSNILKKNSSKNILVATQWQFKRCRKLLLKTMTSYFNMDVSLIQDSARPAMPEPLLFLMKFVHNCLRTISVTMFLILIKYLRTSMRTTVQTPLLLTPRPVHACATYTATFFNFGQSNRRSRWIWYFHCSPRCRQSLSAQPKRETVAAVTETKHMAKPKSVGIYKPAPLLVSPLSRQDEPFGISTATVTQTSITSSIDAEPWNFMFHCSAHVDDDRLPPTDALPKAYDAEYNGAWTFCTVVRAFEALNGTQQWASTVHFCLEWL